MTLTRRVLAALALAACGDDGWDDIAGADELIEGEFVRREYVFDPDLGRLGMVALLVGVALLHA